jgi:hypothetical protein
MQVVCLCSDLSAVFVLFLVWFSLFTVSDVLGLALILDSFFYFDSWFIHLSAISVLVPGLELLGTFC